MQRTEHVAAHTGIPNTFNDNLASIDAALAKQNLPIAERPLAAVLTLVRLGAIMEVNGTPVSAEPSDIVGSEWFGPLWRMSRQWYREQYGPASQASSGEPMNGFLLIRGTPIGMRVPPQIERPGEETGTIWLHLVDRVLDEEVPLKWVLTVPPESDITIRQQWQRDASSIAAELRFIQNRTMSLDSTSNREIIELARTILSHLSQAAGMVTSMKSGEATRSYWELQMAAEAAFKTLLLQRTGDYLHTHDLHRLSDKVRKFEGSFSVPCLQEFPDWKTTANMRYGVGEPPTWENCYRDYLCTLETVRKCAALWKLITDLTDAKFLLTRIR